MKDNRLKKEKNVTVFGTCGKGYAGIIDNQTWQKYIEQGALIVDPENRIRI